MMDVFPKPNVFNRPTKRFGEGLAVGVVLSLVMIWSIFAIMTYGSYEGQWNRSAVLCGDVAALLQQDISRNIELYDLSIKAARDDLNDPDIKTLPIALQRKVLFSRSMSARGLGSILVVDKSGNLVIDSNNKAEPGLNVADRDYFRAERTRTDQSLPFVSHPLKSRISHMAGISFSQRRTAPDGAFDGVVVGMMTLDYFAQLFKSVHLPNDSAMTLLHSDGTILMREPEVEGAVGKVVKPDAMFAMTPHHESGIFVRSSAVDGIERMFAYKQVGALPIYMIVGVSTHEFMQKWWLSTEMIGLGFILLSVMIVVLGFMLAKELDRRTEAERTLEALAATDGLTHLANRRGFDEALHVEWGRAKRDATSIALLMIDSDFFKAFNDSYGHMEGDEALRSIAGVLQGCAKRPGDLVARFGGEEFVMLLPRTDAEGAAQIAEAVRQAMAALDVPHRGSPIGRLTFSIGIASRRPTSTDPVFELLEAADAALYAAKDAGRDCIIIAPHDVPSRRADCKAA